MFAQLIHPASGETVELGPVTVMGRSADVQVRLEDNRISRQHAMIRTQDEDEYWFYDLGSVNGSFVNERRVLTGQRLKDGDQVRLLDHVFEFRGETNAGAAKSAEVISSTTEPELRSLPVLVMVADVRGYTGLSERLEPQQLAQLIGGWYRECTRIIESEGGVVDKFIGDAVLAYWTDASASTRTKAMRVPAAINAACARLAAERVGGGVEFSCGYGFHVGPVILGHLGGGAYTLVGDTVNIAFRLQTLTRPLAESLLMSSDFVRGWPEGENTVRALGWHAMKGHSLEIEIYGRDL